MGMLSSSRIKSLLWIAILLSIASQSFSQQQQEEEVLKPKEEDDHNTNNKQEQATCEGGKEECPNPDVEPLGEAEDPYPPQEGDNRLLTWEEFRKHTGEKEGDKIYLSILGKVYDVTKGAEFYQPKASYEVFAGHDGVVPFISGTFTKEEADKSTDALEDKELFSLKESWVKFYREEEKYPYLGKLIGKYYDETGEPSDELKRVFQRWRDYKPPKRKPMKPRKKPKEREGRPKTSKVTKGAK